MRVTATLAIFTLLATATLAGPPPTDALSPKSAGALLTRLVRANVASSNCSGFAVTNSEWKFIVDTADQLANQLGLDSASYDERYYGPAFDALDSDDAFCDIEGPFVIPLLDEMIGRGGFIDKYKIEG